MQWSGSSFLAESDREYLWQILVWISMTGKEKWSWYDQKYIDFLSYFSNSLNIVIEQIIKAFHHFLDEPSHHLPPPRDVLSSFKLTFQFGYIKTFGPYKQNMLNSLDPFYPAPVWGLCWAHNGFWQCCPPYDGQDGATVWPNIQMVISFFLPIKQSRLQ